MSCLNKITCNLNKITTCNLVANWQDEDFDDMTSFLNIKPGVMTENLDKAHEQAAIKIQARARGMRARRAVRSSSFFPFLLSTCMSPYPDYVLRHSTKSTGHATGIQTHGMQQQLEIQQTSFILQTCLQLLATEKHLRAGTQGN